MLTRHQVELIEIPQRMGSVRKNAADIKMAVDAIELCFERDYITTFVLGTGDSDFTPARAQAARAQPARHRHRGRGVDLGAAPARVRRVPVLRAARRRRGRGRRRRGAHRARAARRRATAGASRRSRSSTRYAGAAREEADLDVLVTQTLSGSSRSSGGPVLASMLKRAILRKDPTFSEADLRVPRVRRAAAHTSTSSGVVELDARAGRRAIPRSRFPTDGARRGGRVRAAPRRWSSGSRRSGPAAPVGPEDPDAQGQPDFTEKRFGYGGFLQFVRPPGPAGSSRWSATTTPRTTSCGPYRRRQPT